MIKYDSTLQAAINTLLGDAQSAFTSSPDKADIKESADRLRDIFKEWQGHDKRVRATVSGLLKIVCDSCDHAGAATGYNERDGGWMSACPTCGETR